MTRHVFFAGFSLTLSAALTYYVNSSFLESLVGKDLLGFVYALSATTTLILILLVPRLGRRYGLLKPIRWFTLIFLAGFFTLAVSQTLIVQLFAFIIIHAMVVCLGLELDIYLETLSTDQRTGRIRGGYLTVINTAVLISPYISGAILNRPNPVGFDYQVIYWLALLTALPLFYQVFWRLAERPLPAKLPNWHHKLRDHNLRKILTLDFLLNLFYFFMVIYLPLHLVQTIGFSWQNIGLIFTIMLLPFVLIEYLLGWLADRKFGEKEILSIGLVIAAIFTLPIAFMTTISITTWALLLFATRVGASAIESMKETYLFKKVTSSDIGIISLSRLTVPFAYLVGSLGSVIFLLFFPLPYLFLLISLLLFLGLYFSLTLEDTR
ncbi:MAG: MFS transporter [Candidatus Vogelbacteria bacterium]